MSSARSPEVETVYTATSTNRSGYAGEEKVFHTDEDCKNLKRAVSSASHPRNSLSNGWRECQACSGDLETTGEARSVTCPLCGEDFQALPLHMRGCDG